MDTICETSAFEIGVGIISFLIVPTIILLLMALTGGGNDSV